MSMLEGVYNELVAADAAAAPAEAVTQEAEKTAAEQDAEDQATTIKLAKDYDAVGRQIAHHMWPMYKAAAEEMAREQGEGKEEKGEGEGKKEEGKKEEEEKGEKKPGFLAAMAEKKASILARMRQDPEYARAVLERNRQ